MNTIKNLALRAAAAAGMLGVSVSNALAQPLRIDPVRGINTAQDLETKVTAVTNVFVGFIALVAVIMLVYGAYLYITAGANEDNAKKGKTTIVYAIIGILIAASVYIIVNVAGGLIGGAR